MEAIYTMQGVCLLLLIGFMDDDFCAGYGKWSLLESNFLNRHLYADQFG